MNFDLDDEHKALADSARDFLSGSASAAAARAALEEGPGADVAPGRAELVKSGFATITVPETAAGGGGFWHCILPLHPAKVVSCRLRPGWVRRRRVSPRCAKVTGRASCPTRRRRARRAAARSPR